MKRKNFPIWLNLSLLIIFIFNINFAFTASQLVASHDTFSSKICSDVELILDNLNDNWITKNIVITKVNYRYTDSHGKVKLSPKVIEEIAFTFKPKKVTGLKDKKFQLNNSEIKFYPNQNDGQNVEIHHIDCKK